MEAIYPPEDGKSVIPQEKLDKAIKKGIIQPKDDDDVEDLDDDLDSKIDESIKEVWGYYDDKKLGFLDKKKATQFFKDALEVFALRKGKKSQRITPTWKK